MTVQSIICSSPEEILTKTQAFKDTGFQPSLAFVFASTFLDREATLRALDDTGIDYIGATTAGEFIDEQFTEHHIALLLMDLREDTYKIIHHDAGNDSIRESGTYLGKQASQAFNETSMVVFAGGNNLLGDQLVDGILSASDSSVDIHGAYAGDDFTKSGTWAFCNGLATNNGAVAVLFDQGRVSVQGIATNGWKPIGTVRTITKSEANVVYTIDNQPALDVLVRFMGIEDRLEKWNDVMINIGSEFPLQVLRQDGPAVIRAPLYANMNDRSLICAGNVPEGSKVRFSLPPSFDVIQKVVDESTDFSKNDPRADAVLMFSCKTRHVALGPLISDEIKGIKAIWNAPLAGFFSYGEIGRAPGGTDEYHNNTCAVITISGPSSEV